jgi:phosphohistidine phosphatase SixA
MLIDRRNLLNLGGAALLTGAAPMPRAAQAAGGELSVQALLAALRAGGQVILMRHASSPRDPPDPGDADPENVDHERQLDAGGTRAARELGEALRRLRIPVGPILCSPTYRARQTARLAQLSPVQTFVELGDQGHSMQAEGSGQRGAWLREQVAAKRPAGSNTLIITHLPNITEAYPKDARNLEDGEALIFARGPGGARLVARVKISDWPRWT